MLIISRQVIGIARIENRSLDVQGIARLPSRWIGFVNAGQLPINYLSSGSIASASPRYLCCFDQLVFGRASRQPLLHRHRIGPGQRTVDLIRPFSHYFPRFA